MQKILTTLAAVAALGLSAVFATPVITDLVKPEEKPAVQVFSNPGGSIFEFINTYGQLRESGTKVEIRGVCASACTFFLGLLPKEQVCYDDRAYLGFHGVYMGGFLTAPIFDQPMTQWTYNYVYTPEVVNKLKTIGWSMEHDVDRNIHPTGLIWQKGDFLKDLGYQKCD